jgi:hypothetical protein
LFCLGLIHCGIAGFYYIQVYGGVDNSDYKKFSEINTWLLITLLILEILEAIYLLLRNCFGRGKVEPLVLYGKADKSPIFTERGGRVAPVRGVAELQLDLPKRTVRTGDGRKKEWSLPKELGFVQQSNDEN